VGTGAKDRVFRFRQFKIVAGTFLEFLEYPPPPPLAPGLLSSIFKHVKVVGCCYYMNVGCLHGNLLACMRTQGKGDLSDQESISCTLQKKKKKVYEKTEQIMLVFKSNTE
jgi:hypothetical protein